MTPSEYEFLEIIACNREAAQRTTPVFQDRAEAGMRLANEVDRRGFVDPVVIAVVCGGVPVALPLVEREAAPLHLFFAAKIPFSATDRRFGIGATTASGTTVLNDSLLQQLNISKRNISWGIQDAHRVLRRNSVELAHLTLPLPHDLRGKTAIVVDDGVASGLTMSAVIADLRPLFPDRIAVATAVCSQQGRDALAAQGVEVIATHYAQGPEFLVDNFFVRFDQLTSSDVRQLIQRS